MIHEYKTRLSALNSEYGKIIFVAFFVSISLVSLSIIVTFSITKKLEVSFLDVGQGDAILIQTPSGKTMLIDGGVSGVVLERLADRLSYFDHNIDVMVATHPDADHVTGLIPVLEKYTTRIILTSPITSDTKIFSELENYIVDEHADIHVARSGDVIDFHDGVIAKILYPGKNYHEKKNDTNDASVSIVVTYGDKSFLLTGDLPTTEESHLLLGVLPKNITVYKAGHHGSKYSSGEQLLSYIKPEYGVISAGKNNRYGHPSPETLERLEKYSKEIISTIDRGTITFSTDGNGLKLETSK